MTMPVAIRPIMPKVIAAISQYMVLSCLVEFSILSYEFFVDVFAALTVCLN
jgi:hypothetical protein